MTRLVVAFREAEVDQHGPLLLVEQDIARLDVEVVHLAAVQIAQRLGHLPHKVHRRSLGQRSLLNPIGQRSTVVVLHHVVGRAVRLEDIINADDVGVVQLGDMLCLLDKFGAEAFDNLAAAARAERDMRRVGIALAELLHEELLDGHLAVQGHLRSEVRDAETTLTEHRVDAILAMLELGIGFE